MSMGKINWKIASTATLKFVDIKLKEQADAEAKEKQDKHENYAQT